jgi:ABC-type branched-subunit amino acid transport system ATPase component
MAELLRAIEVSKRFPGVLALDRVSFELRAGEVHALVGENGAGKSTLVNIFAGSLYSDGGTIELEGRPDLHRSPHYAQELGIRAVFQHLSLVPALSVAENIFLGRELTTPGLLRKPAMQARSVAQLGLFDAGISPTAKVRDLTVPQRYLVEIAKATLERPKVLILDEPTASLTDRENARALRSRPGTARARGRGNLDHAPLGGTVRDRRPRDGDAGWSACRDVVGARDDDGPADHIDDRSGIRANLPSAAAGSRISCSRSGGSWVDDCARPSGGTPEAPRR